MNTESARIPPVDLLSEHGARRPRVRRRITAAHAARHDDAAASPGVGADRADTPRQTQGARVLRRWSVAYLIARAGGAPRAMA